MDADTLNSRLRRAGELSLGVPLMVASVAFVVLAPAAVAVKLTEWVFGTGSRALEIATMTLLMLTTAAGLWWTFTGRRVSRWLRLGRFRATGQTTMIALLAVASFASLTAVLYRDGAVSFRGAPIPDDRLIDKTSEFFVWHLADSIPLLDIPRNLAWQQPLHTDDRLVGLLVIVFTGIVVLPLVAAVRLIAAGLGDRYGSRVVTGLRRSGLRVRVPELVDVTAVVDDGSVQLVVDAVEAAWNADPELRRLAVFTRGGFTPDAYLLVAETVGDRAREELERALAAAPMPAALLVWRRDEVGGPLGEAARALLSEARRANAADPTAAPTTPRVALR